MSDANAIGMNTGYPQADIRTGAYATPFQQPISRNVVTGVQDAAVNPYTGQAQFADGGSVGGYTFDPRTGIYTKPNKEGATTVSPTGGLSGASGSSGGSGVPSGPIAPTTPAEFAAQSARNQVINDTLTSLSKMGPTSMLMSGLNTLFGSQAPAPVGYAGTAATQQAVDNALSNLSANQSAQAEGGEGIGGGDISGQSEGTPALAQGGITNLGDYSDGGRLLRGPGDGVSDSIPATIANKQPARLADGEFVVPARIVSELGNGSTEAGARKLYQMLARVQNARKKSIGQGRVAVNSRADKMLPA
jgi:hypothetical protein